MCKAKKTDVTSKFHYYKMTKILIITTLDSEFDAFKTLFIQRNEQFKEIEFVNSFQGLSFEKDSFQITLVKNTNNGKMQTTLDTYKIIEEYSPNYIMLVGIAESIDGKKINIGDIVVGTQILDFSNEKIIGNEHSYKTYNYKTSSYLINKAKKVNLKNSINELKNEKYSSYIQRANVHFGKIVSSDKIITSNKQIESITMSNRDIVCIDMESSGIAAANENSKNNSEFIVIRSISDVINMKSDNSRLIACHIAATFAMILISDMISTGKQHVSSKKEKTDILDLSFNSNFKIGEGTILNREFNVGKAYLNSSSYAKALSEILSESNGEICFALLGHWGRGKTYLMHLTANELNDSYESFWFSAWKYKTKPELWIHLYENICEQVNNYNFFKKIPLIFQGKILQFGYWPIIFMILSISASIIPLGSVLIYLLGILGVLGFIKLSKLFTLGKNKVSGLKKYALLNKFSDKLGLQALLGKELKYLLLGIFNKTNQSKLSIFTGLIAYLISITIFNLSFFWGLNNENEYAILKDFTNITFYPNPSTIISILIVLDIFLIIIPLWLLLTQNKKKKALLIVDDLDRLTPNEMLDIIESLKLFLEDEKINHVLQIVMIFEENTFKTAIRNKYSDLVTNSKDVDICDKIYNENMQKLFIAHLNLPPLSLSECIEYSEMLLDYKTQQSDDIYKTEVKKKDGTKVDLSFNEEKSKITATLKTENIKDFDIKSEIKIEELSNDEKLAIINSLSILNNSEKQWVTIGPRAIQSFVFKYKLCRKLIEARKHEQLNPTILARLIANRISNNENKMDELKQLNYDISIINAVLDEIC